MNDFHHELTVDEEIHLEIKGLVPMFVQQNFRYNGRPIKLEDWQLQFLGSTDSNSAFGKPRQFGFSFICAMRCVARAMMLPPNCYHAAFSSINQEEAMMKIHYSKQLWSELMPAVRQPLISDNKLDLWFANQNSIRSFPTRAIRGLPHAELIFDEFAHIDNAEQIYNGSKPATVRANHGVTIGSTPFGQNAFYNVMEMMKPFDRFVVHHYKWWDSEVLCKDVPMARLFAPGLSTAERVHYYGTTSLIEQFESLPLDIFQQEFEENYLVTGNQALDVELITRQQNGQLGDPDKLLCHVLEYNFDTDFPRGVDIEAAVGAIARLIRGLQPGEIYMGYDVGRKIHATEIILLSWFEGKLITRLYLTLRKTPFPIQRNIAQLLMKTLSVRKAVIDCQGMGMEIAEFLTSTYGGDRIYEMSFHLQSKDEMVTRLIKFMEEQILFFYPTRRILTQLQAVKKVVTAHNNVIYTSAVETDGQDNKSHADLFWAMAMASWGAAEVIKSHIDVTTRSPLLWTPGGRRYSRAKGLYVARRIGRRPH